MKKVLGALQGRVSLGSRGARGWPDIGPLGNDKGLGDEGAPKTLTLVQDEEVGTVGTKSY